MHTACMDLYPRKCPLGQCKVSIIPPTALNSIDSDGKYPLPPYTHTHTHTHSWVILLTHIRGQRFMVHGTYEQSFCIRNKISSHLVSLCALFESWPSVLSDARTVGGRRRQRPWWYTSSGHICLFTVTHFSAKASVRGWRGNDSIGFCD